MFFLVRRKHRTPISSQKKKEGDFFLKPQAPNETNGMLTVNLVFLYLYMHVSDFFLFEDEGYSA